MTPEMLTFCKTISEAACDKLILAQFTCSQSVVGTREHRPITEKGILRRVSVTFSKLVSNFKEANKNLKIVLSS